MRKSVVSILTLMTMSFELISIASEADMTVVFNQDFATDVVTAGSDDYATYTPYQTGRGDCAVSGGKLSMYANEEQANQGYYLGVKAENVTDWNSGEGTSNLSLKFQIDANTDHIALGGEVLTTDAETAIVAAAQSGDAYVSEVANDWGRYRGGTNSQSYLQIYPTKIVVFDKTYNLTVSTGVEHTVDLYVYGDNTFSIYLDETQIAKDTAMDKFVVRYNYYAGAGKTKQRNVTLTDQSYFRGFYEVYLMHYAKKDGNCLASSVTFDDMKISIGEGKHYKQVDTPPPPPQEEAVILQKNLWTQSFEECSLNSISNGITVTRANSAEASAAIAAAYEGDGIVFGMDAEKRGELTDAQNQYMTVPVDSMKRARFSFDVKIDKKPEEADKRYFTVVLRDDASKGNSTSASVQHNIQWRDKLAGTMDYEEEKWYRIIVYADTNSGKCSITLIDKATGETATEDKFDLTEGINEIDLIRIHSRRDEIKALEDVYTSGSIYIDNFTLTALAIMPEIETVNPAVYDAGEVSFTVSERLLQSSVTKDNISIVGVEGEIPLKSASYNDASKTVTLTLSGRLRSSSAYTIELSENVCVMENIPIGAAVSKEFTTERKTLEFSDVSLSGSVMSVTADNADILPQTFCMIVSVWNGNEFVRSHVKTHTITTSGTFTLDITPLGAGERAELYIWDSLVNKTMLLNEVE